MLLGLGSLLLAVLALVATYLFTQLYHKRFKQFASLPQLPPSLVWGHMLVYDEFTKREAKDLHPGKQAPANYHNI